MVNQEEPDDMELCDLCDICKTEVKRKDMQRGFNIYTNDEPPAWEMICNNCLKSIENTSVPEDKDDGNDGYQGEDINMAMEANEMEYERKDNEK